MKNFQPTHPPIRDNVTVGVSTTGNLQALQMCLLSVLNGTCVPSKVNILFDGEISGISSFYLEQLCALADFRRVQISLNPNRQGGVRAARDWHLSHCSTNWLWMLDDDVVYDPDCLDAFGHTLTRIYPGLVSGREESYLSRMAYICGVKADINNRRGYGNFSTKLNDASAVTAGCSYNHFYDKNACKDSFAEITALDTGNVLFYMPVVRKHKLRFGIFPDSVNAGGEDTLFALVCHKLSLSCWFSPVAQAIHLEKPVINFKEDAARVEMILRACDTLKLNKELARKNLFAWVK